MPVVDITVRRGRSQSVLRAIADGVHEALVEQFGIPVEDRFQVIQQKEPYEFIYSPDFLGGPRTEDFVLVRIVVGKERPVEKKHALYRAIVENLTRRAGVNAEDVFIMLDAVTASDLSAAGGRPFNPPHLDTIDEQGHPAPPGPGTDLRLPHRDPEQNA
ncbi:tautomerase family protein [Streptomyces sp. NPDC046862]|uniref:tautomerase family protein n=1 Tax=Streptomyces sp. NPDC046862 TaxID=3154603 RepID=UPI003453B2F2